MTTLVEERWLTAESPSYVLRNVILNRPASPRDQASYEADMFVRSLPVPRRTVIDMAVATARTHRRSVEAVTSRQRLNRVNAHFRRKAAEVYNDDVALRLLAVLYEEGGIDLTDFDPCQYGIPLAKLTAANFCHVGANVIYISEPGQHFIQSIQKL